MHNNPALSSPPYFHAKKRADGIVTEGAPACTLGQAPPTGSTDRAGGIFVQWNWDGRTLKVTNDRYGLLPLFYFQSKDEVCVSPSLLRLLQQGAPTDLDYTALSVFLRWGNFIGNDTPFRSIRVLPPGGTLLWKDGEAQISGQYFFAKAQNISREEALDTYIALFRQSIERRLPQDDNFTVPLSGGRDSRHILLELCRLGCKPSSCVTLHRLPPDPNQDPTVAALVASALKIRHVVIRQRESWFSMELRKNRQTELCTTDHGWLMPLADFLDNRVDTFYDGIAGDILSAREHLSWDPSKLEMLESRRFTDFAKLFLEGKEDALELLIAPEYHRQMTFDCALEHFAEELKKHSETAIPLTSFYFWNRIRRRIALSPFCLLNRSSTVICPYLDSEVYDFLSSLPASFFREGGQFHQDAILRAYPEYACIPFERKDAPPTDAGKQSGQFARALARHVYTQVRRPSRLMANRYLMPRLLRCLVDRSYSESLGWLSPPLILYLFQLEMACAGKMPVNRSD